MSIKQSVVFTDPQMKWLQKRAKELGISVSDLIRRLIDAERSVDAEMKYIENRTTMAEIRSEAWRRTYAKRAKENG